MIFRWAWIRTSEIRIEKILWKNQNIFWRKRSTSPQILTVRRIIKEVRAKNLQVTQIFVDFSKAFDSIHTGKMEQILFACGLPKETVAAIMMLYKNTKVKFRPPDGDTDFFDIVVGVLQRNTLAPNLFITCRDFVLRMSIDLMKESGFTQAKARSRQYPVRTRSTLMT